MTTAHRRGRTAADEPAPDPELLRPTQPSVGELFSEITRDLSGLMRQEVELAKAEVRQEAKKAARSGALMGAGGYVGHLAVLSLLSAVVVGIGTAIGYGWSALLVGVVLAALAGALAMLGRAQLRHVNPTPERTIQTLEEDLRWARHPRS